MRHKTALVALLAVTGCSAALAGNMGMRHAGGHMISGMQTQMQQCMSMMKQSLGPADKDYDKRFIDMMIPHHEGAIDMAKDAEKKAQHPELRKMAHDIITAQEKEIKQMQQWRTKWYGSK